jgi:putative membrane protein insertion efficiency factor
MSEEIQDPLPRNLLRRVLWYAGWPFRWLLLLIIKTYQRWISPALPSSCKYHPSCSSYAAQSLQRHGAGKGTLLAGWRVLKCNPFSEGGVNPIPERGRWRAEMHTDGKPRGGGNLGTGDAELGDCENHPDKGCASSTSKTESTKYLAAGV